MANVGQQVTCTVLPMPWFGWLPEPVPVENLGRKRDVDEVEEVGEGCRSREKAFPRA